MKGKIILVSFPFDDLSSTKVRPAVCLTDPVGPHRHVVVAFITSQMPDDLLDTDIVLSSEDENFTPLGLRVTSVIRLHRVVTLSTSIIRRELGVLPVDLQTEVDQKLGQLFGLEVASGATETVEEGETQEESENQEGPEKQVKP